MGLVDSLFAAKPAYGVPPFAPAPPHSGGAQPGTTPESLPVKHGLSGFLDRFMNPTNALGQFGRALVMASGGPIGNAYALMDQSKRQDWEERLKRAQFEEQQRKASMPRVEQIGSQLGVVDPATGAFTPTYTAPEAPTAFERDMKAAGIDPHGDEGRKLYRQYVEGRADPMQAQQGFDAEGRPTLTFYRRSALGEGSLPGAPVAAAPAGGSAQSYRSPLYDQIEGPLEQKYRLPAGLMSRIRTKGERSNADQVSSAGARTVYQVIPATRDAFLSKYKVDAYAGPEQAAEVAALHLRDSIARGEDPVRGYIGGPDKSRWGKQTEAYARRVGAGAVPTVTSKTEYAALPSGAQYRAPDGKVRRKR
jgi:hypothetical protein